MAKGRKKTSDALQEAPGYDQPCRMDGADVPAVIALASEFPKEFEKLVLTGKIEHLGNPLLRWMLASTVVKTDPAGNIKPDKEKSAEKIDGICTRHTRMLTRCWKSRWNASPDTGCTPSTTPSAVYSSAGKMKNAHRSERVNHL